MSRIVRAAVIAIAFSTYPFTANWSYAEDPAAELEEEHGEEEGHEEEHEGHEEEHEEHEDHHGDGDHEHEEYPVIPHPYYRTPGIQGGVVGQETPPASTESLGHIEDLAANLRYLANHIAFDMHYNYQSNPGFQEVYKNCFAFRNLAYTIYDMEHSGGHVEMTGSINELDELFHSIEEHTAGWQRTHRRQVGHGDLQVKMELLEDLMHHLLEDTAARAQIVLDSGETTAAPATGAPPAGTVAPVE